MKRQYIVMCCIFFFVIVKSVFESYVSLYAIEDAEEYTYCKYTLVEKVEPSETEDGYELFYSELCNKEYKVIVATTGRHWCDWIVEKQPTCEEEGKRYRYDIRYPHIQEVEIVPIVEHDYTSVIVKEATCEEEGILIGTCIHNAHETYEEKIPIKEHTFSEWRVVIEAKPEISGVEVRICSLCDTKEEREVPALSAIKKKEMIPTIPLFNVMDVATIGMDMVIIAVFVLFTLPMIRLVRKEKKDYKKYIQQMEKTKDDFHKWG